MSIFRKSITTLNIESDSIRLLRIKGSKKIEAWEAPVPENYINNTSIVNPQGVADTISTLCKQSGVSRRGLIVAMNDFRSVYRFITLPKLSRRKVNEAVMWAAEREMPMSLDTMYVTWQLLEKRDNEHRVFLLGVPRETFVQHIKVLWAAGISTRAIDSKLVSLARLIDREDGIIVDIENSTISIILQVDAVPVVMQTMVVQSENQVAEDRVNRATEVLFRIIDYYNKNHTGRQINSDTPIYVTGGVVNGDLLAMIKNSTGRTVNVPGNGVSLPEGISAAGYAANLGLYLREKKTGLSDGGRKAVHQLKPDFRKAENFRL